jgi:anti-anti-sigma factor
MTVAVKEPMDIAVSNHDDATLFVHVAGSVIDQNIKKMQDKFDWLYKKGIPRVVLDVSGISFLDSHGLGVIVYMHTLMQKSGRQFIILNSGIGPSAYCTELFAMTNLDKVLTIVERLEPPPATPASLP